MPAPLRQVSVHVEEAEDGAFQWVLSERLGERWEAILSAPSGVDTYRQSMADGLLALQGMIENLDIGPRAAPTGRKPPAAKTANRDEPNGTSSKRRRGMFGFGLVT
jgi:hypothetical protein